ncbi:MAG TPA: phosphopantetheine-binding protein [Jatrophihabitans sp.]|uniref:phosphopantetheine-binding protein n=1 Tax=Jatrophihabitans sp. TaxID=1932789 RepID=UPI002EE65AAD
MRLTEQDFLEIINDELGLPLHARDLDDDLDSVVSWDSMLVMTLLTSVERRTGRQVQVGRLMAVRTLREIYQGLAE